MSIANYIKTAPLVMNLEKLLALPCADTPSLWVSVAEDTLLRAFLDVLDPDPKEVYHRLRGKSLICDIKGTLDDATPELPLEESASKRFTFKLLEVTDMGVWYVFLADVLYEGAVNATSMAIKMLCKDGVVSPYTGSGDAHFGGLSKDGSYQPMQFNMNPGSIYYPVSSSQISVQPGNSYHLAAQATFSKAHLDTDGIVSCRLRNTVTGAVIDESFGAIGLHDSHGTNAFTSGHNHTSEELKLAVEWAFHGTQSEPGTAMILTGGFCSKHAFIP